MTGLSESQAQETRQQMERVLYELKKVIVGQERLLERLLVAIIAGGHVLVEGSPGLAKTLTLKCLSLVLDLDFQRVQFTPDLLPSDLLGTRIYNPSLSSFHTEHGPIFAHFVMADEINRAPAKVQSALLEAMQENQVTIGRDTFPLPSPFLVMATQNPIESEGTFMLPEAQLDRFMFKLPVGYPDVLEEVTIINRMTGHEHPSPPQPLLSESDILAIREKARQVYLDPKLAHYIAELMAVTRRPDCPDIRYGSSPRGSLALATASRALALIHGRTYVTPADINELVHDCLRHRLILSYEGLARGLTPERFLDDVLTRVSVPVLSASDRPLEGV